jgi:hypothetical protein
MKLDKLLEQMDNDGGEWREVRFWTKESTNGIFEKGLSKMNGLADVKILKDNNLTLVISPQSVESL